MERAPPAAGVKLAEGDPKSTARPMTPRGRLVGREDCGGRHQ
jgi:hypothetical protein